MRQGLTLSNPVAAAEIPEGAKESRSPFTNEQVGALLDATETLARENQSDREIWKEWKTCIMIGYYTGVRLGDTVDLTVANFDFEKHVLKVRPQKTRRMKRDLIIPLHPQLESHVRNIRIADGARFCPHLALKKVGGKSGLSNQFHLILEKAGVKQETVEAKGKNGRDFNKFTFHSLRHSFVSELANAGIAPDVRQLLSGHADERSHAVYTHTQLATLRRAIDVLPRLGINSTKSARLN
jgi:integrase